MSELTQALRESPAFAGLDEESLGQLGAIARDRQFQPGEAVFRKGDPGDALYVILEGAAEVVLDGDGADLAVDRNTLSAGDFFGEMAIIWGQPRSATIAALEPLRVVEIPRGPLIEALRKNPALVEMLQQVGLLRSEENRDRILSAL